MLSPLPFFLVCLFLPPVPYAHSLLTCTSFLLLSRCFLSLSSNLYFCLLLVSLDFVCLRLLVSIVLSFPLLPCSSSFYLASLPVSLSLSGHSVIVVTFILLFISLILFCFPITVFSLSTPGFSCLSLFILLDHSRCSQSSFLFFPSFFRLICACFPGSASLSSVQDCCYSFSLDLSSGLHDKSSRSMQLPERENASRHRNGTCVD